jgi:NitT/TauT family transport system permease protein
MAILWFGMSLTGWRHVVHILIPAAFPTILAGLKIGWACAWRTLIAAELVFGTSSGSGGLGWLIAEHRNELAIDHVFARMLVVILVGLLVGIGIFRTVERLTVIGWACSGDDWTPGCRLPSTIPILPPPVG